MALTRITKGVIKPNENYDTHNINSTGIITAVGANFTGDVSVGGILTYEDVTSIDSVGIITARQGIHVGAGISVVGVGTFGSLDIGGDIDVDGHTNLDNISIAGVTTVANDTEFIFGTNATATRPLKIKHQSSNTRNQFSSDYIDFNIIDARFKNYGGAQIAQFFAGSAVNLFYNGTQRLSTAAAGAKVFGNLMIEASQPNILFTDTNHNNDFSIKCDNGSLQFVDSTDSYTTRMSINSSGNVSIVKDLDVDGHTNLDNVSVAGVTTFSGNVNITNTNPKLFFYDTNNDSDYAIVNNGGVFRINDETNSLNRFSIDSNGNVSILKDLDVDGHTNLDNVSVAGVSTFSGVVRVPNGSAAAPAIHFGDSDSGVYGDSSNGVRLTAGGSDTIVATTNGVTFPPSVAALTSLTLGSQSALSKPLYFADAASVQSASILLDNSSQELRIKNGRFSGQITFTTYNVERLRIKENGVIQFNGTNSADNTNKLVYLTTPSYDTDEEPFGFIHSGTYNNQNLLYLGGGMTSSYNACTLMKFYTTNSINTQVGTERLCIESWGGIQNNQGAIYGGGAANEPVVHFNGAGPSNDLERGHLAVSHNAAYNASPIARISLVTRYNSSGGYTFMGGIEGGKANTTDNNFDGFVRLMVRKHGQGNIEGLRITSAGTVNIGGNFTNTANTFYVNSSLGDAAKIVSTGGDTLTLESTVASSRTTLKFHTNGNDWEIGARGSSGNPNNHFYLYDNAVSEYRVVVNPSGFVGIGTANPTDILDINSDSASAVTNMYLRNHANLGGAALNIWTQGSYNSPTYKAIIGCSDSGGNIRMGAHSNHDLLLLTNNDPKVTIKTDGSVVIRHNGASASDGHAGLEVRSTSDKYQIVASSSSNASNSNYSTLGFKLHPSGQNERIKAAIQCQGSGGGYGEVSRMMFCLDSVGDNGNAQGNSADEKLRIESSGDIIFKNNGGDNRIERNTTSGGPYLLFHNRGADTTDSSGVYNLGGVSAAGYRDVANPGIVGSMQFVRQPTAGGASSGCDIIFRTGFNGTTSHTAMAERMRISYTGAISSAVTRQALSYTAFATPTTYTHSATGNTNVTIDVSSVFGVPDNAKAILVQGWYHVGGYSQGNAGQADHATSHYSERSHSGSHPWSFTHDTSSVWGQYVMDHDGDASGSPHHYGMWGGVGVINVNPNGNIYGALYWGYSGGTHYNQLWCFGYYM